MPKILIVDHDPDMTTALAVRLSSAGFEVKVCHCSHSATRTAVREKPDLIILDVDMPVFTGLEFHECLQYAERCRDIPVIFLSASDSPSSRLVALRQGARAFFTKPYETKRLIDTIDEVLSAQSF